jgi:sigma-B regulation protein RsbU (phosphoserine phosphatase)
VDLGQLIPLIYLASGLILFALTVIIFRENPQNRLNRIVSLMLFFAGIAPFSTAIYKSVIEGVGGAPYWLVNSYYLWELFFPTLLYFSAIFPEPKPIFYQHKRLLQLAFLPHLLHLVMVLLLAEPDRILGLLEFESHIPIIGQLLQVVMSLLRIITSFLGFLLLFHTRFFSLINLIYVVTAIYLLQTGYRKISNPRLKSQVRLVIQGILGAMGLYVVGFLVPEILSMSMGSSIRDLMAVGALIVGPGTIAWAIVRYQFLDIGLIARRSLVYSITTAIVVGGYLLVIVELGSIIRNIVGQDSQILNVLVIIVLLLFFQPIYNQVDDFVRKIFVRTRADYSQLVESFSREILTIFQADKLAQTVSETLRREMFIENVEISFTNSNGQFMVAAINGQGKTAYFIEPAISGYLLSKRTPAFTEEFTAHIKDGHLGAEAVARGYQIAVPLIRHDKGIGSWGLGGLLLLSPKVAGFRYNSEDMTFLAILGNYIVVAMENAELYAEALEKQRLEEELAVAKQIQTGLLPKSLPVSKAFEFATYIEPSRQVGGDYYDFIPIRDGRLGIVIADASGKGVPAALLIARMQAIIQSEARLGKPVNEIMTAVNQFISQSNSPDRFATCFYGEIDEKTMKLHYCNAGHNYPILVKDDGGARDLDIGGLLLGAFPDAVYQCDEIDLAPGDLLVMYTDGLSEMMDASEQEFGEKRIFEQASRFRHQPVDAICAKIVDGARQFAAPEGQLTALVEIDDMTLVVIKANEESGDEIIG